MSCNCENCKTERLEILEKKVVQLQKDILELKKELATKAKKTVIYGR
jgi:hypothetical protein